MMKYCGRILVFVFLVLLTGISLSWADTHDEKQTATEREKMKVVEKMFESKYTEEMYYKTDRLLLTATRRPIQVKDAPAIAAVISGEEIREMGARNLIDVLERIPGFGVNRGYFSLWEIEIRGLKTARSEKIKLMIDGHSMNYPVWGGAAWAYDAISLDQVERIEIIRGPGSALYGANAFTGIINVVTQMGNDLDGTVASAGFGSFGSEKHSLIHGKQYKDMDILASITYSDTDGAGLDVKSDQIGQTGSTDDWAQNYDAALKVSWKNFVLNSRYLKMENGPYVGVAYALNDESKIETDQLFVDLSFYRAINAQWAVNAKTYIDYLDMALNWEIFPEGHFYNLGVPGWSSDDSMLGTPSMKNKKYGLELGTTYEFAKNNTLTLGLVYEKVKHYDLEHHTNFNPLTFISLGSFQDITSWGNWGVPAEREIMAVYLQDEWEIIEDVHLTGGVRYDHYSDFGGVANPKIGLVWSFLSNAEFKLLYGEAFRAPNFEELYLANNPATKGNSDLEPERIRTYEASLGYRPIRDVEITVSSFYNKFRDRIELVATSTPGLSEFQNKGEATIYGIETEAQYRWDAMRVYANYTWQRPKDDETDVLLQDVPSYRWNLGMDMGLGAHLNWNTNVLFVGDRPRAQNDTRDDLDSYTLVNATLIIQDLPLTNLEVRGSVYNIFNENYAYPAPSGTLEQDYPAQGVNFFLEMRYIF